MSTLNITAREFKALVTPVLPLASTDRSMQTLCAVRVWTAGKWLIAGATDRYRIGLHRQERTEGGDDWAATIPVSAVKGILSTFAPMRALDADLALTIDGDTIVVSADGALSGGFFDASFRWNLESGEFPALGSLIKKTLGDAQDHPSTKLNFHLLAAFKAADPHGEGLWVRTTGTDDRGPLVVTNGENFVGLLMPRKGGMEFPALADWDALLDSDDSTAAKKTAKKAVA